MGKFNFSRKLGDETFQIEGCNSFDEARKIVDRAVYDRQLEIKDEERKIKESKIKPKSGLEKEVSKDKEDVGEDAGGEKDEVATGSKSGVVSKK